VEVKSCPLRKSMSYHCQFSVVLACWYTTKGRESPWEFADDFISCD